MARGTIAVTEGSGENIDFDEQASRQGQVVVLRAAAAEDLLPGTATDGLLVNLGANNDVVEASAAAIAASLSIVDDWDETNRAAVNIIAGQVGIAGGTGVDGATVPRVTLATNVALPAGTNNIGDVDVLTLPALPAGTNNIGDVDVLTLPALPAGTNNIGDVDVLTVPADPFGANADASVAAGATGSIQAKLRRATQGLEDLKSLIVLAAGANAIGKLAANSGVDIGDVDVTSIAAGTNLVADVGIQPRTTLGFDTFMASGSDGSSILVATDQTVKASAGKVYGYYIYNPEAAVTFVHFYNDVIANVTVGTTAPQFTLAIPAGAAANLMSDIGITFGTAITVAATTTAGGNTAPATGASAVIWYK